MNNLIFCRYFRLLNMNQFVKTIHTLNLNIMKLTEINKNIIYLIVTWSFLVMLRHLTSEIYYP